MFKWIWLIMIGIGYICGWLRCIQLYISNYKRCPHFKKATGWWLEEDFVSIWLWLHIAVLFASSLAKFALVYGK